jgi:LysR family transcriptional regulator, regulator for bpeEF and oprC
MDLHLFRGVVPFVAVAEERSFRRAAARLGVSPAAVSKAVQALEAALGVTLFARGSRAVGLTPEGELLFERSRAAVAALEGAREAMESARRVPEGELCVSAPFVLTALLASGLALLRARYPRLTFRALVTDRLSRMAEESVDIAVRVGPLPESSLVVRRLRATRLVTVAAPGYLSRRGAPTRVEDLARHDCLVLVAPDGRPRPYLFRGGPHPVTPTILIDQAPLLVDGALAGLGVTQLFDFMAAPLLRQGLLTQLLEEEAADGPPIHAVCTPGRRASPRIRAAFSAFADAFADAGR